MTCILRAGGTNFDVDDFVRKSSLVADSLWRKGEKRFPRSKSSEEINGTSGVRFVASEADFSELSRQIEDVIVFLRKNQEPIRLLASFPGVEGAVLDFGAEIHPPGWTSFTFPAELLLLAGSVGVSLCLSVYPTDIEGEADASRSTRTACKLRLQVPSGLRPPAAGYLERYVAGDLRCKSF